MTPARRLRTRASGQACAIAVLAMVLLASPQAHAAALVLQTDFGLRDGAVAAMKGVAVSVAPDLAIYDLTHEIPAYNIWEAALRLDQSASYWPPGTVFVSVVDPGVGSERHSVVLKTRSGHYFVTPDNGTLTFVADSLGVEQVREIDEKSNRLSQSGDSYTFHGRDVYAYTAARLASGVITFSEVGPDRGQEIVRIPYQHAVFEKGTLRGGIPILDIQYGNVWTNIDRETFLQLGVDKGEQLDVRILANGELRVQVVLSYVDTFAGVAAGQPLLYFNSLGDVSFAINQGSFAQQYGVASGPGWTVAITAAGRKQEGAEQ
jgi:S-adenosylmethionine hydrolase